MKRTLFAFALASMIAAAAPTVGAFCGFYVARADTKLFNRASQVVLVRDGDRTVVTMASDYQGDLKEFAVVIPVPTLLTRGQIHVGDKALVDHLDAYSAPRLVEYFDQNPCQMERREMAMAAVMPAARDAAAQSNAAKALGVRIDAQYTVGEYDILILSAEQSSGLETWLRQNGYRIPDGATSVIDSYLKQNMRFFVARVNVQEQARLGVSYLRPLQIAYESPKFMLPIRLGMVNARGPQEMYVYALTRNGRVETTNYRTVRVPSDVELPVYLKQPAEFGAFYKAMFARQAANQDGRAVFLEYAWDMRWCDPCAADPLPNDQLRQLGVFWVGADANRAAPNGGPANVFVTRLHVRYDNAHFPEDLVFQETADRTNFQGRYVLRHPWTGSETCAAVADYRQTLQERNARQAESLARLTGWTVAEIRRKMGPDAPVAVGPAPAWWERLWK
ncbi:MAG TPA: DUF2330 domain-containing protein [Vicinamibacterales bacterium]|jgi:hypothetical protein